MTTYQVPPDPDFRGYTDDVLLALYHGNGALLEEYGRDRYALQQEIIRRCTERKANGIPSERFDCAVTRPSSYSQVAFTPLLEIFNPGDVAACYEKAHTEEVLVAAKWKTPTVIATAKRYGEQALKIVEGARIPGQPEVAFKQKKEPNRP